MAGFFVPYLNDLHLMLCTSNDFCRYRASDKPQASAQ